MADEDNASSIGNALQIYGRIDVSLDKTHAQVNSNASYGKLGASVQKLTDNTSRLGFREPSLLVLVITQFMVWSLESMLTTVPWSRLIFATPM